SSGICAQETVFYQDVALINGISEGLPKGSIDKILIVDNAPMATSSSGQFEWRNSKWISNNKKGSPTTLPNFKGIPKEAGKVLSTIHYRNTTYVGCENGLYKKLDNNKWKQELSYDINYSWALKEVAALTVDSKDRLWFGAKQGIGRLEKGEWKLFTGREGVPYNHFTCASPGSKGMVW